MARLNLNRMFLICDSEYGSDRFGNLFAYQESSGAVHIYDAHRHSEDFDEWYGSLAAAAKVHSWLRRWIRHHIFDYNRAEWVFCMICPVMDVPSDTYRVALEAMVQNAHNAHDRMIGMTVEEIFTTCLCHDLFHEESAALEAA